MKATINHPLTVKAAGNMANGGYKTSRFDIKREGDCVRVSGTNGYSSISFIMDGEFSRWPDGKCITLGPSAVRAMMTAIGTSLKKSEAVTFETVMQANSIVVSCNIDGAAIETIVELDDVKPLDSFDWESQKAASDKSYRSNVNPYFLDCAARAMKTAGIGVCDLVWNDGERAMIMRADVDELKACALVVSAN